MESLATIKNPKVYKSVKESISRFHSVLGVSQGYITGELKDSFSAANIVDPEKFVSLLYYFGMLIIAGMIESRLEKLKSVK